MAWHRLGSVVVVAGVLGAGCAAAPPRAQPAGECAASDEYRVPAWAVPASRTEPHAGVVIARDDELDVAAPQRATRVLRDEPERDPVDAVLGARGARRRLGALSLRQAPVDETLRMFAAEGGFNLVLASDLGGRRVSLDLHNVSVEQAFRSVLAAAHLAVDVVAGDVLAVRSEGAAR